MYRGGVRVAARRQSAERAKPQPFPAATLGWVTNTNLASMPITAAVVLDNWLPTRFGLRMRGGAEKVATIGSDPIVRLFPYYASAPANNKLFAASADAIYEISGFNATTAPSADLSSLNSGAWSVAQQGAYLVCVNGADTPRTYNGSWANSTISFSGSYSSESASNLSYVWKWKSFLFFVKSGSTRAYHLAAGTIANNVGTDSGTGAIELGQIFRRGGALLFGGTISLDAGDGPDDRCVFVSDKGEVAVYAGTDPASASTFSLVGVYEITPPLGPNAWMRAGGDLVVATHSGLVSLSQASAKDVAALSLTAVSEPIEPSWLDQVANSSASSPWELLKLPRENLLLVTLPHAAEPEQYVVNLNSGRWARYTGWAADCVTEFENLGYFGDASGSVFRVESSGADDGAAYTARVCWGWSPLGSPGRHKQIYQVRGIFNATSPFNARVSVAADYNEEFPAAPNAAPDETIAALWDAGKWDISTWDVAAGVGGNVRRVDTRWRSAGASGNTFGPQVQITSGSTRRPEIELIRFDVTFEDGGIVV